MHEVSMMQNTLDIAIAQAKQNNATKIDRLTMNIGELSGVVTEALEFAFEVLVRDTIAENAKLEIKTISVVCHCQRCDKPFGMASRPQGNPLGLRNFEPEAYIYQCPHCGQISSDVISGRELELASVVVSG